VKEIILCKLGEVVLKGQNRYKFEEILIRNIHRAIRKYGEHRVVSVQSTIYVYFYENIDMKKAFFDLKKVFGIVSLSCALEASSYDFAQMCEEMQKYLSDDFSKIKTFRVTAKRADKNYPFNSPQIGEEAGYYILNNNPHLSVDLHNPDLTVCIEVREGRIYVHAQQKRGAGGLPSGTSGHGLLMLSGGLDSPVAGYMMAKRGLRISAVHFESPPYTSERAKLKVIKLAKILGEYVGDINLYVVSFTQIQEEIRNNCPDELFTIIMRRFMVRISQKIAQKINAKVMVTGESLGQVASQTLDALVCTDNVAQIPVFRPLIGMDKRDIIHISQEIETYETSIEPFEDCCTVFTPKHPKLRPLPDEIERAEEKLNLADIIDEVVNNAEKININDIE